MSASQEITDLCQREHSLVRAELHDLKKCQVEFLVFSVTASATILGITAGLEPGYLDLLLLVSLLILLPSWWVFFDKARTITRCVGYVRVLEAILLGENVPLFIGWERALKEWRHRSHSKRRPKRLGFSEAMKALLTVNPPYWLLVHWTFAGVSAVCILVSALVFFQASHLRGNIGGGSYIVHLVFLIVGCLLWLVSALHNAHVLYDLMSENGKKTYLHAEILWRQILGMEPPADPGARNPLVTVSHTP